MFFILFKFENLDLGEPFLTVIYDTAGTSSIVF